MASNNSFSYDYKFFDLQSQKNYHTEEQNNSPTGDPLLHPRSEYDHPDQSEQCSNGDKNAKMDKEEIIKPLMTSFGTPFSVLSKTMGAKNISHFNYPYIKICYPVYFHVKLNIESKICSQSLVSEKNQCTSQK